MTEDQNAVVQIIRAIARPAISVIFAAAIAQVVIEGRPVPEWFLGLAVPTIAWWFTSRTYEQIKRRQND